jgi:hypothetical protein
MVLLDDFEEDVSDRDGSLKWIYDRQVNLKEYRLERVSVHPLDSFTSLSKWSMVTEHSIATAIPPSSSDLPTPVEAQTYIYGNISGLNAELWSFDDFVKHNAWKWI